MLAIKLRAALPNPLQLVTNHYNAMSKLLNATKYAIEHRAEDGVQLFQVQHIKSYFGYLKIYYYCFGFSFSRVMLWLQAKVVSKSSLLQLIK